MAAIAETFIACIDADLSIDGTTYKILDGSITQEVSVDDFTNNEGAGFYEDVGCITKYTFNVTLGVEKAGLPAFVPGLKYAFVMGVDSEWVARGGDYLAGNLRINSVGKNSFSVKSGYKWTIQAAAQGTVVTTRP